jgi:TonB family protein
MKGTFRTFLPIVIVITTTTAKVRAEEPACDFSKYRPLVISHSLEDAAVKTVEPKYPAMGTRVRAQGEVTVKIMVDRKGNVVSACANEGHPLLRAPAIHAAVQWKFKPNFGLTARQKKKYIQSLIVFKFRLD